MLLQNLAERSGKPLHRRFLAPQGLLLRCGYHSFGKVL